MKKLLFPLTILFFVLTSCGGSANSAFRDTVSLEGSTSMTDVISVLQESFREREPDITVNFSGTGSGAGVESVLSGTCEIGLSSRSLTASELQKGAVAHLAALDGIAVVVNPACPVTNLTFSQLEAVFTGQVTSWEALGGPDFPVAVCGREGGSGTRAAFESFLDAAGRCVYTNEYGSAGDITGSVASNPNAIGYTSFASVNNTVKILQIDGVSCTETAIQSGEYPIQRPFLMVTKQNAVLSKPAQTFLNYALSPDAAPYISLTGAVVP